ncbi:large conductance mechanosensitive channel protein MscL [Candidatus Nomurabacteria bacterium]|nr:large conductance mechanosensitive channel protein MscL [Candidatus Nomurabacteria bacterium]
MIDEFKKFALKGNMIDLAVGIIIGGAFGTVVKSLVDDILTPVISSLLKLPDFSNYFWIISNPTGETFTSLETAREAGASVLAAGQFLNALIAFLLMAWALFFVVKGMNKLKRHHEEAKPVGPTELDVLKEIRDSIKK